MEILRQFVNATKLHPILVNFTAALIPFSVFSDCLAKYKKNIFLRETGWWALLCATVVTPFTAAAGWLFWMKDDNGVLGMTIHKWLGTSLAILLFGLFYSRHRLHRQQKFVNSFYIAIAIIFVLALIVQGHLGGSQTYSSM